MSREEGLRQKYVVQRVDGKPIEKGCIVLEFDDPNAWPAILRFAETVRNDNYGQLAVDLENAVMQAKAAYKYE